MAAGARAGPGRGQHSATFHGHGVLRALLPTPLRAGPAAWRFNGAPGVKDAIEALGLPHTEIGAILANGRPADFAYRLLPGDRIDLFPPGQEPPEAPRLSPVPASRPAFILDVHLGRLARLLRLLGYDCLYDHRYDDGEILRIACADGRVILSRDRGLLKRRRVVFGCLVRSAALRQQAAQVVARYGLRAWLAPWSRCLLCNGLLEPVAKEAVARRLASGTRLHYEEFVQCDACGKVYWQGAHAAGLRRMMAECLGEAPPVGGAGEDGEGSG